MRNVRYTWRGWSGVARWRLRALGPGSIVGVSVEPTDEHADLPQRFEDSLMMVICVLEGSELALKGGIPVEIPIWDDKSRLHIFGGAETGAIHIDLERADVIVRLAKKAGNLLELAEILKLAPVTYEGPQA